MAKEIYRKVEKGELKKITEYGGILFCMLTDVIKGKSFNAVSQLRITPHKILTETDITEAVTTRMNEVRAENNLPPIDFQEPELWVMGKYEIFTMETQYGHGKGTVDADTAKTHDPHTKIIATKEVYGVQSNGGQKATKPEEKVVDVRIVSTKAIMAFQESGSQVDRTSTEEVIREARDLSSKNQ